MLETRQTRTTLYSFCGGLDGPAGSAVLSPGVTIRNYCTQPEDFMMLVISRPLPAWPILLHGRFGRHLNDWPFLPVALRLQARSNSPRGCTTAQRSNGSMC